MVHVGLVAEEHEVGPDGDLCVIWVGKVRDAWRGGLTDCAGDRAEEAEGFFDTGGQIWEAVEQFWVLHKEVLGGVLLR